MSVGMFYPSIDGRILNVVNGDLGNANTSYTYFGMAAEDKHYFTLAFTIQNTTLTLEACMEPLSTADASANWVDVTNALTGAANATATGVWIIDTPLAVSRLRVVRLTTNATNALALYLTRL